MSQPWLSIVVPTSARRHPELFRTLASIEHQLNGYAVEVLVVADTHGATDRERFLTLRDQLPSGVRWFEHDGGVNCYGQPQRTFGARQASGEWVAFSQDDNILAQGAIDAIWLALCQEPHKRPLFFRIQTWWGATVWSSPQLVLGNIDADCLVFPRAIAQQVSWGLRYEGDYDAAVQAAQLAQGDVDWREETIAIARPDGAQLWWERST